MAFIEQAAILCNWVTIQAFVNLTVHFAQLSYERLLAKERRPKVIWMSRSQVSTPCYVSSRGLIP